MLDSIIKDFKIFRDKIYQFFSSRRDASFELVDALSSNTNAKTVVELSLNAAHRRNYCSTTRVLDEFYPKDKPSEEVNHSLTKILTGACLSPQQRDFYLFATDCTSNPRLYASTQQDRGFVHAPTRISGNKPITIGHQYSLSVFLPEKKSQASSSWVIPLACHRVTTQENGSMIGMKQISQCIQSQETFKNSLCVSVADSAYSKPECVVEVSQNPNQVHITRVRGNRNFYYPINITEEQALKRGRKKKFGLPFKLSDESTWEKPDETTKFTTITAKGKKQIIEIKCWNTILMRGTQDANISNHPFRLVQVCVYKENGELFFKKPLWLIIIGKKQMDLTLHTIYDSYRQRFDIEHFFRYGKNKLLMNKSQTPEVDHEEAWWQCGMIAYTQLYLARELAQHHLTPWEKYLPKSKSETEKSPTQVQKDFARIIQTFGTPAQPLKLRKKALGRKKGDKQTARKRYPVIFKSETMQATAAPT